MESKWMPYSHIISSTTFYWDSYHRAGIPVDSPRIPESASRELFVLVRKEKL